ncbi:MAG: hypothetical protein A4S09_00370 [Proteobacteria bacterium SG_bin7]|nr:MAG: hypothetical protein A4S09_00370 [Proteobacteria bacterium SG_bin7]
MEKNLNSSANLDFLRSVAISYVVIAHTLRFLNVDQIGRVELSIMGKLGVVLFFVHTSLVLMMSLQRQIADFGQHGFFKYFYLRRAFRIYPLSILAITSVYFFKLPMVTCTHPLSYSELDFQQLMSHLGLYQNFYKKPDILGPLWSLPFEVQMYIVFPLLFLLAKKVESTSILLAIWAGLSLVGNSLVPKIDNLNVTFSYYQIPNFIEWVPCFFAGVIAFHFYEKGTKQQLASWWLPVMLFLLVPVYILSSRFEKNFFVAIILGLTLPLIKEIKSTAVRFFSKQVAKYSYGLYLCHYISLYFAFELLSSYSWTVRWLAFVSSLVGISMLSYHLVEQPFINFGNRIVFSRKPKNGAHVSYKAA